MNRGTLVGGTITDAAATYSRDWSSTSTGGLDALGNWRTVKTDADGGGAAGPTSQDRTHDSRNQLTGVGGVGLTFDANGNTLASPATVAPNGTTDGAKQYAYDAWNRNVQVKDGAGVNLVQYAFDGLGRRVTEDTAAAPARTLLFSAGWQVLEEREGTTAQFQNVWSPAYVDALILRDVIDAYAAGALDTTFSGDGKLVLPISAAATDDVRIATQADGKILAGGVAGGDVALAWLNADGSLDTTFGADGPDAGTAPDGFVVQDFGSAADGLSDFAVLGDGRIVIAGVTNGDLLVARFTAAGVLDTTFGTAGKYVRHISGTDTGYGVEVDSAGRIVVGGTAGADMFVLRLTAAGALDTAGFNAAGTPGYRTVDFGATTDYGFQLALDGQDRPVVAGNAGINGTDVAVARLTASGAMDATFSGDGQVTTNFGGSDWANAVRVDDRGRIVIAGRGGATSGAGIDVIAARYTDAGALDLTFGGGDGMANVNLGGSDEAEEMVLDGHGRLVIVGHRDSADAIVVRLSADGSADLSFSGDGQLVEDLGSANDVAKTVAVQADGRIVAAGRSNGDFAFVARRAGRGRVASRASPWPGLPVHAPADAVGLPRPSPLAQVLSPDGSCRAAVSRLMAFLAARAQASDEASEVDAGPYCKARQRLPETLLGRLTRQAGEQLHRRRPAGRLLGGRPVKVVDGTTVSMPDTPENQKQYPQPATQKPGLGLPIARRLVAVLSLSCAAVLGLAIGPYKGEEAGETALLPHAARHAGKRRSAAGRPVLRLVLQHRDAAAAG